MRRLVSRDSIIVKGKLARGFDVITSIKEHVLIRSYRGNYEERLSANSVAVGPST
jgi:hypothetical protein